MLRGLEPGGWIEQLEFDINLLSEDGSLKPQHHLFSWGKNMIACGERAGRPLTTQKTMKAAIEKAGFVDVHEHAYKVPLGPWAKDELLKEAGRINYLVWTSGLEGYAMWLLTKFGAPEPWTKEEVHVFLASVRKELLDPNIHAYQYVYVSYPHCVYSKANKVQSTSVGTKADRGRVKDKGRNEDTGSED